MNSFLFSLNTVLPLVFVVALGYFAKRIGVVTVDFGKAANKLVFHVFLPIMLFLNVYEIESLGDVSLGHVLYSAVVVLLIFALSVPLVISVTKQGERRGALLQGAFRSNYALIGIALAESLYGAEGLAAGTLITAFIVPLFNVLAVISLSMFKNDGKGFDVKRILLDIVKNPLIQGIAAGALCLAVRALFVRFGVPFRISSLTPLYAAGKQISGIATPLALFALGATFEFSVVKELKKEIIFGVLARSLFVPILGIGAACIFFKESFTPAQMAAVLALFATPIAVSSVPMAQETGNDAALAGQLVVWTTIISALTVFLSIFILRSFAII